MTTSNLILYSTSQEEFSKMLKDAAQSALREELAKLYIPQTNIAEDFITRKEVKSLLRMSLPTVDKLKQLGILKAYRIGSKVLFNREEVLNCLQRIQSTKYRRFPEH